MHEAMKLIALIIGIAGALLGVYFRESLRLANQQKIIVSRLRSYLLYYQTIILEEGDLFQITNVGTQWHNEYLDMIKKGEPVENIIKLNESYEEKLKGLKKMMVAGDEGLNFDSEEFKGAIKLVKRRAAELIKTIELSRQNIIDGKTFITDGDAALLGEHISYRVIELKMRLLNLIDSGHVIIWEIDRNDTFEVEKHAEEIYRVIRATIIFSRCMESTIHSIERIQSPSVLALAYSNMIKGI
jgi:type II secretory pathway pseudopilin PulG